MEQILFSQFIRNRRLKLRLPLRVVSERMGNYKMRNLSKIEQNDGLSVGLSEEIVRSMARVYQVDEQKLLAASRFEAEIDGVLVVCTDSSTPDVKVRPGRKRVALQRTSIPKTVMHVYTSLPYPTREGLDLLVAVYEAARKYGHSLSAAALAVIADDCLSDKEQATVERDSA